MLKPFNGEAVITSKFSTKHPGLDYALPHRTAIIAVYSGQVVMLEKDISKKNKKGVKQWIANTDNDPYKYSVGKIIFSRKLKTEDYGNFVKVDHSGKIQTLSAHLDEVVVTEGQWVKKGEILGYSDSTGNSTGGHVHFAGQLNNRHHQEIV